MHARPERSARTCGARGSIPRSSTPGDANANRGDLDPQALAIRKSKLVAEHELERRNHQLEVENRKLQRKIARFELIEDIRKKAAGLLNIEYKSPEFDDESD